MARHGNERRRGPGGRRRSGWGKTPGPRGRGPLILALAGVGMGLWACDGSNAFQPITTAPRVVELEAPSPSPSGEPLEVSVRAVGDSVRVMFRVGDVTAQRRAQAETGQVDLRASFSFDVPLEVTDTVATLHALAVDRMGNVSPLAERRLRIVDRSPPSVSATASPATPLLGAPAQLRVTATDNVGLRRIGVRVLSQDSVVVFADSASASGRSDAATFTWGVPATLPPGEYLMDPFALDAEGNGSAPAPQPLALVDELPPVIQFLAPAAGSAVVAGDSVLVRFRVTDNDGVRRVTLDGSALYGDPDLGTEVAVRRFLPQTTDFEVAPADTILSRYLRFDAATVGSNPPQVAAETLRIRVTAVDASGTESRGDRLMQLRHDVNPPQVTILDFAQDQMVNPVGIDTVRVRVSDSQGLVRTGVRFVTLEAKQITGSALDGTLSVRNLAGPVDFFPQEPPIIQPRTLAALLGPVAPSTAPGGVYFLIATSRDVAGNVAADSVRLFWVPPPEEEEEPGGVSPVSLDLPRSGHPLGRAGGTPSPAALPAPFP